MRGIPARRLALATAILIMSATNGGELKGVVVGEDGKPIYREDGKVLKGPNYQPPNIAKELWGEY